MEQATQLWTRWLSWLSPFAVVFTRPGWVRFVQWVTGMVLCWEDHTPPQLLTAIGLESRWRVLERFADSGAGDHQAVERHTLRCSGKYPFGFPRLCNELYNTPLFSYLRYAILTFCA
jgi:hypothetical protein